LLQYSSVSWGSNPLDFEKLDKDCTGKAFTDNCLDTTNLFGANSDSYFDLAFTLLTPDTLPAVGASINVIRNFYIYYPYNGEGSKITITVGRNTWCNSDGTSDCPVTPPPDDGTDDGAGGTDEAPKWY
jgi:hypothetical protein